MWLKNRLVSPKANPWSTTPLLTAAVGKDTRHNHTHHTTYTMAGKYIQCIIQSRLGAQVSNVIACHGGHSTDEDGGRE